ncbi:MAG: DegT/DnrJ/EryC1/StrS family aminotransferase [Candidatus Omnitrophica bacterium]|nr:DegT/DnrJ/EryC1/StrS family aminotransferase [Candidatus Omnitrophota bacterium]
MPVPFLDLKIQHQAIQEELLSAISKVIESQIFILGPFVEKIERRLAAYCGTDFAIGLSSGTDALLVSLTALGVGPRDEVITTAYSFFATAGAIARLHAKPVFVDIDRATYNLNPNGIEKAITPATKAILVVHLFGQCAEMNPILKVAEQARIPVIEDAAQAVGAEYQGGRRAGSMGTIGCLSFFPTKNLSAMGDGGMVVTNDPKLAEKVRMLRVHGAKTKGEHLLIGGNFRLDALQAAILDVKLNYLDNWIRERGEIARSYRELFEKANLDQKGIIFPEERYSEQGLSHPHTYHQFVIRVPRRDDLKNFLKEKGIETAIYYPLPIHLQPCFAFLGYRRGGFPESERAAQESLALPIYPGLGRIQQEAIMEAIAEFYPS